MNNEINKSVSYAFPLKPCLNKLGSCDVDDYFPPLVHFDKNKTAMQFFLKWYSDVKRGIGNGCVVNNEGQQQQGLLCIGRFTHKIVVKPGLTHYKVQNFTDW